MHDAASAYVRAARSAAAIENFKSAAAYATKAKNLYHKINEDPNSGYDFKREIETGEFADAMRHEAARRKVRSKKSWLERLFSVVVTITIASFLGAIYFLSPNTTGNIIGVNNVYSNWIGGTLFIVGLVGVFLYFKFKSN